MISCVLLTAGFSQRFGSPKALASMTKGEPIIARLQHQLLKTSVDEIVVVLGYKYNEIKPFLLKHKKVKFVYNKHYNFGQTSSFKTGLGEVHQQAQGVMLLPVDYPLIKSHTIQNMIDTFKESQPKILVPVYDKRGGHPPIFHKSLRDELFLLDNTMGLNIVIRHTNPKMLFPVSDPGVIQTFNTVEELEALKKSALDRGSHF